MAQKVSPVRLEMDLNDLSKIDETVTPPTTGLAFSGGGVRSAALCSGVLRRLLQKSTRIDCISSVSGGGYVAASYMDWKIRNGKKDDPAWHKEYFSQLRDGIPFLCNYYNPCQGLLDTLIILAVVVTFVIIFPVLIWAPYAFPIAFCTEYIFGQFMRAKDTCKEEELLTIQPCKQKVGSKAYYRDILFATTGVAFFVFYMISRRLSGTIRGYVRLIGVMSGAVFCMTFVPWLIYEFVSDLPLWLRATLIVATVALWFIFPVLRSKVFFILFAYFYALITYWRIYRVPLFDVLHYKDWNFDISLFVSGLLIWLTPLFHVTQQTSVFLYTCWRLQRAFFHPSGTGLFGCAGISLFKVFQYMFPCRKTGKDTRPVEERPLTLADLDGVSPQLIINATVNEWKLDKKSPSYKLLMITPQGMETLHSKSSAPNTEFNNRLMPHHLKLSEAMMISAGFVARRMGEWDTNMKNVQTSLAMAGLTVGTSIVTDQEVYNHESVWIRFIPMFFNTVRLVPLVVLPLIWLLGDRHAIYAAIGALTYMGGMVLATIIAVQRTGSENPGFIERLARWLIAHDELHHFIRNLIRIDNIGPNPPPILELSDGGHFENLGLLPLLKKRLKKIVLVNGSPFQNEECYANDILIALRLARDHLHCSFIGYKGRDVTEDIRDNFARRKPGHQPRSYRFRVEYYEKESLYENVKVGELKERYSFWRQDIQIRA